MDWKRFQDPSFFASALSCVLLIVLLAFRTDSPASDSSYRTQTGSEGASPSSKEFEQALSIAESHLDKNDFAPAFDMVMVASRIAPSDPRLFDLVTLFVENAKSSDNEEAATMAEDLLDSGDSLVHFQSPTNVELSRKRLEELRQSFITSEPAATSQTPLDSVRKLLAIAENPSVSLSVRSRAVEEARSRFDDVEFDQVISDIARDAKTRSDDFSQIMGQIDDAERRCINELFLQAKPKIDKWFSATQALSKEIDTATASMVPDISKKISDLLNQGFEYLQELMPFSKSGVEGASDLSNAVEKQTKFLQRQKNWLYNQQVLRLIRDIESKSDWTTEDKIRHLAEVSEELLSPYVIRRHNDLWEKLFENLPDEDKKAWAVRLRILRLNE